MPVVRSRRAAKSAEHAWKMATTPQICMRYANAVKAPQPQHSRWRVTARCGLSRSPLRSLLVLATETLRQSPPVPPFSFPHASQPRHQRFSMSKEAGSHQIAPLSRSRFRACRITPFTGLRSTTTASSRDRRGRLLLAKRMTRYTGASSGDTNPGWALSLTGTLAHTQTHTQTHTKTQQTVRQSRGMIAHLTTKGNARHGILIGGGSLAGYVSSVWAQRTALAHAVCYACK